MWFTLPSDVPSLSHLSSSPAAVLASLGHCCRSADAAVCRYGHVVKCTGFSKDSKGNVTEVTVEKDASYEGKKPPKGVIHWVAQPKPGQDPEPMEVRLYSMLFKSPEPDSLDDYLEDLDTDSLEIIKGAYGTAPLYQAKARTSSLFPSLPSSPPALPLS